MTYSNEGFEVAPFKLKQETLSALAGGTLKYGRFRIGRCSVKIPSVSGVVSTVLFGSARDGTDPVRIHIESVEFDKLPFRTLLSRTRWKPSLRPFIMPYIAVMTTTRLRSARARSSPTLRECNSWMASS